MQIVNTPPAVAPRERLCRLPEVEALTGCKKSTIYLMLRQGRFPKPVRLSARMVAWPESAVVAWVRERIAESDANMQGTKS